MSRAVFVGALELQHDVARAVTLEPFVGDCRAGDIAAQVLQLLALIGAPTHRRVEAKAVRVDTQLSGGRPGYARQALQAQTGSSCTIFFASTKPVPSNGFCPV